MRYDSREHLLGWARRRSHPLVGALLLESDRVSIPSLPSRPSPQVDPVTGRRDGVNGASGSGASAIKSDADVAFAAAFPNDVLSPAVLAEDGRTPVSLLHDARDQAARIGGSLEQIAGASDGVAQVQMLVGQLRDVAVVSLDWALAPADRAMLQRQVDRALAEIDAVAERTLLDDRLLYRGTTALGTEEREPPPFRVLGTATLGIAGLAVRSTDQAFAASGALDVAAARLERTASTLTGAATRLQGMLNGLTRPTTTATGDLAIGSSAGALNATVAINAQILSSPQEAIEAQGLPDVDRVKWLLDPPSR
jgi:hypothetical protein